MNKEQKGAVIEEIVGQIQEAEAIFAVDYRGISVAQVAELRTRLQDADARFRVVKNSLGERAADQAGMETLKPLLAGPTALAFVKGDAALAAKALNDAARQLNLLDFKGGVMNGTALSAEDVRSIARLPSREVLTAQLVGTIAAPLSGLVRTLNALIAGVAIQLQAIADQGLVSGTPAAGGRAEIGDAAEAAAEEQAEAVAAATGETSDAAAGSPAEAAAQGAGAEPAGDSPAEPVSVEPDSAEAEAETGRAQDVPIIDTSAASDAAPSDE